MLQPLGPLPASVYWRRRALAVAVVLLILVLGWIALPGGGGDGDRQPAAGAAGSRTPSGGIPAETSLAATPPSGDPGRAGDGNAAPATTAPATAPAPTTPAGTTPPAPKACADGALALKVVPERTSYDVGQSPVLDLQVSNTSKLACVRDLGAAQQEIVLYRGSQRLWSSNDCYPEGERRSTVLAPGASESFEVTWSGLGSRPRCAGPRTRVGAGSYALVGRLGTLTSRRTPITLR